LYIILEYVEHDLRFYLEDLEREEFLPPLKVKNIMYQLLQGISASHS
jgi:serine/threonine protein kinase